MIRIPKPLFVLEDGCGSLDDNRDLFWRFAGFDSCLLSSPRPNILGPYALCLGLASPCCADRQEFWARVLPTIWPKFEVVPSTQREPYPPVHNFHILANPMTDTAEDNSPKRRRLNGGKDTAPQHANGRSLKSAVVAGLPHLPAELWALVMPFMPFRDVLRCSIVNKSFLNDVAPRVKRITVLNRAEMRFGKPASRFRGVEHITMHACFETQRGTRRWSMTTESRTSSLDGKMLRKTESLDQKLMPLW